MSIEIILKGKPDDETATLLVRMLGKLVAIEEKLMNTDEAIAALTQAVTDQGTVIESAATLIAGLAAALEAAKDDPAQLQAVIDQVNLQKDALAAAVAAGTVAAPVQPAP
jgi:ABC-type transporter Mla subunit MlaD